ncbi:TetR/AcrR family transcriptional regulator [Roseivirga sp. E12]|uniref:TetR/AcrR family transcriptional regulator n=1 Tax=Roseivirga sp. E12 TaxID=2819237 RepID=UPI001ABCD45A|nr:TetR/AcrR family transcriptional regulator [Roseivirga sp. E12]MBO3697947.1 TetR/AcrR family transcriptional regulator [Roseivirga sp. E12]
MPKDGSKTRYKILDETMTLVLENGFAGTTIDHILERTDITKGAFFYHFKSKADLALSLMEYFARLDIAELNTSIEETAEFSVDPKKRLIKFVQRFIDLMTGLETPYPGCLYASYVYEPEQFGEEIKNIVKESTLSWREAIGELIEQAAAQSKVRIPLDKDSLADHFTVILEGAFIVSKSLNDPKVTANQLIHYRNYLDLIFEIS